MTPAKQRRLQKVLLMEIAASGGVVAALTAGWLVFGQMRDSWEQDKNTAQSQAMALQNQHSALQAQYLHAKESLWLYQSVVNKGETSGFELNREYAKELFDTLKPLHHLTTLGVKMSPIRPVEQAGYAPKMAQMVASDITLSFEGASDEDALALVTTLRQKLTGYVKVKELSLTRKGDVNGETLRRITQGELPPLISGQMSVTWIGSKLPDPSTPVAP